MECMLAPSRLLSAFLARELVLCEKVAAAHTAHELGACVVPWDWVQCGWPRTRGRASHNACTWCVVQMGCDRVMHDACRRPAKSWDGNLL